MRRRAGLLVVLGGVTLLIILWAHRATNGPSGPKNGGDARANPTNRLDLGSKPPSWFAQEGLSGRRIAGHVTFEGEPVQGASVSLHSMLTLANATPVLLRNSTQDGSFDFGIQPPGSYDVLATATDRTAAVVHVDLDNPTPSRPPDQLELRLQRCVSAVSGKITDADSNPIPGAYVRRDNIAQVGAATDGAYRICVPEGETAALSYAADGYGTVLLSIEATGEVNRNVVLVPEATLSVIVSYRDSGKPVASAYVTVWPQQWAPDRAATVLAVSDANGRAQVRGLLPGTYSASAFAEKAATLTPTPFQVSVGPNSDVNLYLDATARIRGKVVLSDKPVAGAQIVAIRRSTGTRTQPVHSQPDGTFVIERVPFGEINLTAAPYRVESPQAVTIEQPTDYQVTLQLSRLGSISGRVTHNGVPTPGAIVCCVRDVRGLDGKTRSDDTGHYEYLGVTEGSYDISAQTAAEFGAPKTVSLRAGEDLTVDLEADLGASISGTVTDQDGKPLPALYVEWLNQKSDDLGRCTTDGSGHFRCGAMSGGGSYTGKVSSSPNAREAFRPAEGRTYPVVELQDKNSIVENVNIAIAYRLESIRGSVFDYAGQPVPDARVVALATPGEDTLLFHPWLQLPSTSTNADGEFLVQGLAPGLYALQGTGPDGGKGVVSSIKAGATNVVIELVRPASIEGLLAGFASTPMVYARPIGTVSGDSKAIRGTVDGTRFHVTGLEAGRYIVTAQSQSEGDAQITELSAGATATMTLTSHGTGTIEATVVDFRSQGPIAGAICQPVLSSGGEVGVTNWNVAASRATDAAGYVLLAPAPAGSVDVACVMSSSRWSRPSAHVDLSAGDRAHVQLYTVENKGGGGTAGLVFDGVVTPPRIAAVKPGSSAARAGLLPGDLVTKVDGAIVEGLNGQGVSALIDSTPSGVDVQLTVRRGLDERTFAIRVESPGN